MSAGLSVLGMLGLMVSFAACGQRGAGPKQTKTPEDRQADTEQPATDVGFAVEITNSIDMKLALIPAGEFVMGTRKEQIDRIIGLYPDAKREWFEDECPPHRVRITKPFYLGVCEVTQGEYEKVMGKNPSGFQGASNPVETVSWAEAVEFCKRLSAKEGKTYRLPTEAEWEYACRAGTTTLYGFGDDPATLGEYGWNRDNSGRKTHPVGEKKPNAWGLYDMHGNVSEWCRDWYGEDYYAKSPPTDPQGPSHASYRAVRGGCWSDGAGVCRSALRFWLEPGLRRDLLGFRVAAVPRPHRQEPGRLLLP